MSSVTLVFPARTRQERFREWRRRLCGLPGAVSLACALGRGVTLRVLAANPPFPAGALAVGFALFVFGWLVSLLSALIEKRDLDAEALARLQQLLAAVAR